MLTELRIQDFAIIDELKLKLTSGFIVFTGETGAGKSIIIDAVEMLLGGRADSTMVRSDSERALLEGDFSLEPLIRDDVHAILSREDMLDDPDYVTIGREIRSQGRNICRINGRTVNLSLLRELGELLVDVHGQSEHLSLLRVREHLQLLDRYANADELLVTYKDAFRQFERVHKELTDLQQREQDAARRSDLLAFQINEIEAAALQIGEDETLLTERNRLSNAEQLATLADKALTYLDDAPVGVETATELLGKTAHALEGLAKVDEGMQDVQVESQALIEQASELTRRLRRYREEIEFNPSRLDEVEERLGLIRSLQRKYGGTIQEILDHADKARQELETITHAEERIHELGIEKQKCLDRIAEIGEALSQARRQAGEMLSTAIEGELDDLRMQGAQFAVDHSWDDDPDGAPIGDRRVAFNASGLDRVEFLVAPNPGEGLKPLVKTASGGETSRLMLGLKSVLAKADRTPTLIFDEIDQGIGGRVGAVVGEKLRGLSQDHQVLCITHLPQLAAYGNQHYKVEKRVEGGRTVTIARALKEPENIPELALMMGGVTESNLESAADLLRQATETR
jgi:DNA repair protein RecN (Recombination protein N)